MALMPPYQQPINKGGLVDSIWLKFFTSLTSAAAAGFAAATSRFVVFGAADPALPNSRILSSSTSNTVSTATAGQIQVQSAALTGDVTASANSNATTIANNAVTFAKMQDIATQRAIGRNTAGTGDPEEVTITQMLDWTP